MQCMAQGICGQCLINTENSLVFCCKNQELSLAYIPFGELQNRSKQNSLMEKISRQWLEYVNK